MKIRNFTIIIKIVTFLNDEMHQQKVNLTNKIFWDTAF